MTNLSNESEKSKSELISGGAWNLYSDHVENWAYVEKVFNPEECSKIIEIGNNLIHAKASTIGGENETIRKSSISWIYPHPKTDWIFHKLRNAVIYLNNNFFQFDITSFSEGLQFTRYYEPDGFYAGHIDKIKNGMVRKLSISIQLNDSSEFDGGDLFFHFGVDPAKPEMKQGKMIAFPSYVLHEVTPVTRGTRYSLVAWISGPPFK